MQFLKNIKNLINFFVFTTILVLTTACMDKIPAAIRKGESVVRSDYYGNKALKKHEIESAYLAAQQTCCGADKQNDDVKALNYYCKAAMQGHKASMVEVGRMYSHQPHAVKGIGTIIPFDRPLAYAYFSKASEDGYDYAAAVKQGVAEKLTAEELARANDLIAQFPDIPCELTR